MLYPKNKVNDLIVNTISADVIYGRHWIIYNNDKTVNKALDEVIQLTTKNNGNIDDLLKVKRLGEEKTLVVFNPEIIQTIFNELIEKIYLSNPKFPRLHTNLDMKELKDKESSRLVNYINEIGANTLDVFLYKGTGLRGVSLPILGDEGQYTKPIFGFYLTEEDLELVNKKLKKDNKEIKSIIEDECLCKDFGIRYTLNIK